MSYVVRRAAADILRELRNTQRAMRRDADNEWVRPATAISMRARAEGIDFGIDAVRALVHRVERAEIDEAEAWLRGGEE